MPANISEEPHTPSASQVTMSELVLPNDTNMLGNLLGGRLLHWIDIAGALAATRHARKVVTTASIESVDFEHPVRKGEMVTLSSRVIWTGRTSMQVTVDVAAENLYTGARIHTNSALLTFVALDAESKPSSVPRLVTETPGEQAEFAAAQARHDARKAAKNPH